MIKTLIDGLIDKQHTEISDIGIIATKFIQNFPNIDTHSITFKMVLSGNTIQNILKIKNLCNEFSIKEYGITEEYGITDEFRIIGLDNNSSIIVNDSVPVFISIIKQQGQSNNKFTSMSIQVLTDINIINKFMDFLDNSLPDKLSTVEWWYSNNGHPTYIDMTLEVSKPVYDEFYPWLKDGVDTYLSKYLESDSSLLFFIGEPGTGKTSLLRYMLSKYNTGGIITYEKSLFESDYLFMRFITSEDQNILIIEDADLMVQSRKSSENTLVNRFLNITDGMIKLQQKKVIITTNHESHIDIDQALVRSGRCFDLSYFRKLTNQEAINAAKVANIALPKHTDDISLADLFNPSFKIDTITSKFGF